MWKKFFLYSYTNNMEKRIGYQKTIIWVEGAYRKLTSALPQLSEFDTFSDDPLNLHYRGFGWKESLIYAKSIVDNRRERQLSVFKCSGVLDINLIYITLLGEFLFKRKMLAGSFVLIKQETSFFGSLLFWRFFSLRPVLCIHSGSVIVL